MNKKSTGVAICQGERGRELMQEKRFYTVKGYSMLEQGQGILSPSMEDYLEMIYRNSGGEGFVRINKLAALLNVKASSASKMVRRLGEAGLLIYERYGFVILTEAGREAGRYLLDRHETIGNFLEMIGIRKDLLIETELMEHSVSEKALERIKLLIDFIESNPDIMEKFKKHMGNGEV